MGKIAILGGTGPEGLGLGLRLAMIGEEVVLGSRSGERAAKSAEEARKRLRAAGCTASVSGLPNAESIEGADLVVFAFPYEGIAALVPRLAPALAGRVVLDVVNPLAMRRGTFQLERVAEGSAAEAIQAMLPESRVVSAFKNESAEDLKEIEHPMRGDVLVCSDDAGARGQILELVARIPQFRPVDAGRLVNARSLEALTALLLNLNRRHRARTSLRVLGLGAED